jgi:uncharacterized protein
MFCFLVVFFFLGVNALQDRLLSAVYLADVDQVKYLISEFDSGIFRAGNVPIVIDRKEPAHGRTSLLQCGFDPQSSHVDDLDKNCTEIAALLALNGANLSHTDKHGWNAIAIGAMKGYASFIKYLADRGVPINSIDINGRTPLMKAVAHGNLRALQMLLSFNASISITDRYGWSALHFATRQLAGSALYLPIFQSLITAIGGNTSILDVVDQDGRTSLMFASLQETESAVDSLLQAGADPTIRDRRDMSAYMLTNSESIRVKLALASADRAYRDHEQWTNKRKVERLKARNQCPANTGIS